MGIEEFDTEEDLEEAFENEMDKQTEIATLRKSIVVHRETDEEIDFPVSMVHPAVLEATEIAMADKIFDQFRLAHNGNDPFVLAEIMHPTQSYRSVTFFVAWFLDVSTL